MMIHAGTDTYGAVRRVGGTAIVTKFFMLQIFPLFPLESYYLIGRGPRTGLMIPLVLGHEEQSIIGFRMQRISRLSVAMAYLRAVAAVPILVGSIAVFMGVMMTVTGSHLDDLARLAIKIMVTGLLAGVLLGSASYAFTFLVPQREQAIRRACGQWLGVAADLAYVDAQTAEQLSPIIARALNELEINDPRDAIASATRLTAETYAPLLTWARLQVALGGDRDQLEFATDSLLTCMKASP